MTTRRRFLELCSAAVAASRASQGAEEDDAIAKAMASTRAAIPFAAADPARPAYHFHAPANWTNDPNGTIFYRGWHHLFYQFNPYGPAWGHMHWGHARSRDLVNWEHLPIALPPSEDKGEKHVFSGSAIVAKDGCPRIIYTSIGDRLPEQWLAIPEDDDLLVWKKFAGNPVLSAKAHGALKVEEWRDPFFFRDAGRTFVVCGGNLSGNHWGGGGAVQLYRSENDELTSWKHSGTVFQYRNREVINIECPNLFKLDGRWVLIVSPHKPCEYFVGSLDLDTPRFVPESQGILDAGNAYASNISVDDKGRAILWLWGRTQNSEAKGWNGVMTMPRILSIGSDGFLRQQPAPEFNQLRRDPVQAPATALGPKPAPLDGFRGEGLELEIELHPGSARRAAIELRRAGQGEPAATISISDSGVLSAGGASTLLGRVDSYKLRVFVDRSVFEVYVNDGFAAMYGNLADGAGPLDVAAFADGDGASIRSAKAWQLAPARFSLDRFQG